MNEIAKKLPTGAACPYSLNGYRPRRGMALIIVMVVVMLIALAAYSFNQQMTDAYRLGSMQSERTEARLTFASGIEYGLALAELSPTERGNQMAANKQLFGSIPVDADAGRVNDDQPGWHFSMLRPLLASDRTTTSEPGWVDESAKLNVLALLKQEKAFPGHARAALMNLPGATPETVDSFLSLIQPSRKGSDSLTVRLTERTGQASPRRSLSLLWTGGDWDHNFVVDPLELALSQKQERTLEESLPAWRDLLTFHSGCRNENRLGLARIHLNDSNLSRLYSRLRSVWDDRRAAFVIAVRQYGLTSPEVGTSVGEATDLSWTPDFSVGATRRIESVLDMVDMAVEIPQASGAPIRLDTPFNSESPDFSEFLVGLLDDVTLIPAVVIDGQINVNLAPAEVLMGIPEISSDTVQRLVRARIDKVDRLPNTVAWLVTEDVLEINELKRLLPWITAGGDCFSTQVVAHRDLNSPTYRGTVTLDARRRPAVARNVQLWHSWSRLNPTLIQPSSNLIEPNLSYK